MTTTDRTITTLADDVLHLFTQQRDWEAAHLLWPSLLEWRRTQPQHWPDLVQTLRAHPVMTPLHGCPFTHRAFHKPRGYAGDAVMLDHMYGLVTDFPHPGSPGGRLYAYTTNSPAAHAVRNRRAILAQLIDDAAERRPDARILALAAGHGRELALSRAVQAGQPLTFIAVDQDADSLSELRRSAPGTAVQTVTGTIRDVIAGRLTFSDLDVVYAAGLFDYLPQAAGQRLVAQMARMLRPGGTLLVANFLPDIPDLGYMEACMDWWLITRTEAEVRDLFADVPDSASVLTTVDDHENVAYGVWQRRA